MTASLKVILQLMIALPLILSTAVFATPLTNIPILCYHNLNPTRAGSMNMTPAKFESQMKWLKDNGFNIITLKSAVQYLEGKRDTLPPKSIVVTFDDGWKSVYTYLLPIVKKYNFPVTLFIYPETISKGNNAMSWEDLKTLQQTGLFDIQSHTYSHPNFKHAKRSLSPEKYQRYVNKELLNSKTTLENKIGIKIDFLAWPFGIYNPELEQAAATAGYNMAFTIDARTANPNFRAEAMPRYMIVDGLTARSFQAIANSAKITNPSTRSAQK